MTTPGPDDAELVAEVLAGHPERYALLVRRHQASLHRQARAMGLDMDVASDLVQDAFIRAWEGLAGCEDPERFRLWIGRILRNRCLDHLKLASTRRNVPLVRVGEPTGRSEGKLLRVAIDRALAALSMEAREAFVLKHVEGRSYEDMSRITGASESALKMRVHRARDALRDALDPVVAEEM